MAAPIAYEQPTLKKAWEAFVAHIPTMLIVWVATGILTGLGAAVRWLFSFIGSSLSGPSLGSALDGSSQALILGNILGEMGQFPFTVLSTLVGVLFAAVPAMYYETGEIIAVDRAFETLLKRPWRYLLAGVLFTVVMLIGFLSCFFPGIAVALVTPVYVNKIFTTDMPILDAFSASFQAVYRSENLWAFIGIQLLALGMIVVVSLCTCFVGLLVAPAVAHFYVQNAAYRLGVLT